MNKLIKSVFFFCFITLIISGCAANQTVGKEGVVDIKKDNITVRPSGSYEECIAVRPGQKMIYRFHSSRPTDFNIHYHGKGEVHYPVSQSEVTEGSGVMNPTEQDFYTEDQEYYCLMWENPDMRPVSISYECTVVEKK